MLFSFDKNEYVTKMPHKKEYDRWRKNLSDADYRKTVDEINRMADESDVNTAGWMPGSDWSGTVYEPLYDACNCNKVQAGLFFGLIVFEALMNRSDTWGFGRYEKDGIPIRSMTYFRVENP